MQKRKLGKTELELTTIGLGTWAIGGPWQYGWGPQDDKESIETILQAIDLGINWLDTAPIYGCGHSEIVIGKALKELAEKPIIATKCGLRWNLKREKINDLTADSILRECDESLQRLKVDCIDLYQMHWPVPDDQIEWAWEAMARCKQEGRVRCLGVCNVTVEQLKRLQRIETVDTIQNPYSMLNRSIEKELLDYCEKNSIGILAYSPMQKGLLTGKFTADYLKTLAPDDHRLMMDLNFKNPRFEKNILLVEQLCQIAADYGKTTAQLAIAWVLRKDAVTSAIVGARRPRQIEQTAPAADWTLEAKVLGQVDAILQRYQ